MLVTLCNIENKKVQNKNYKILRSNAVRGNSILRSGFEGQGEENHD